MPMSCPHECGNTLTASSIYFVNGSPKCGKCAKPLDSSDPVWEAYLTRMEPMVLHQNVQTGEYSVPPVADAPLDPGYKRVEFSSLRDIDRVTKQMTREATEERRMNLQREFAYFDQRRKERREAIRAEISRRGFTGKYFDAVCKLIDAKTEKRRTELMRREAVVYNQAVAFNSSNRQGWSAPERGIRNRK